MGERPDSLPPSPPGSQVVISDECGLLSLDETRLRRALLRILDDHGIRRTLSLALVDDARMREIHRDFLGENSSTDVISFPLEDPESAAGADPEDPFGEVVVSVETAVREAPRHGHDARREAALYAIHGTLHLAGFDDLDALSRREMRRLESEYLAVYDEIGADRGP